MAAVNAHGDAGYCRVSLVQSEWGRDGCGVYGASGMPRVCPLLGRAVARCGIVMGSWAHQLDWEGVVVEASAWSL